MSRKVGIVENPEIVEDYMIGNTRIKIAVNFCKNKTKEEVDAIMEQIKRIAMDDWRGAAMRKRHETEESRKENL